MVIHTLLLVDEIVGVAILAAAVVGLHGRGELNLGDKEPLGKGEDDADHGTYRDQDLGPEIREQGRPHEKGRKRRK